MRLKWAQVNDIEQGVDRGVLYFGALAIPWSGIVEIKTSSTVETSSEYYIDGVRRLTLQKSGDFEATVEVYAYPVELESLTGPFSFTYRTQVDDHHEIHLVYNAFGLLQDRNWSTLSSSSDFSTFFWELISSPVDIPGVDPISHFVIDTSFDADLTAQIETLLYGSDISDATLPPMSDLVEIFESATILKIVQNGDGTWTATGPDDVVQVQPDGSFTITSPSLHFYDDGTFTVSSY